MKDEQGSQREPPEWEAGLAPKKEEDRKEHQVGTA